MYQYDLRFSRDIKLLLALANQKQRHELLRSVNIKVSRTQNESFREVVQLSNSADFDVQMQACLDDPSTAESKRIVKLLDKVLTVAGSKIPYSQQERKQELTRLYSLTAMFGVASLFATLSPGDTKQVIIIRLNHIECYDGNDENGFAITEKITMDPYTFQVYQDAIENPVHCTLWFYRMMYAFLVYCLRKVHITK